MAKLHRLYVGLNDKDTKNQILTDEQVFAIIRLALIRLGIDATIYRANGIYTHSSGINVNESTCIIEVFDFEKDTQVKDNLRALAEYLKNRLNQESIGYTVTELKEMELL